MKLNASPLVVAAALGLLGPAALAEDEGDEEGVAGVWTRIGGGPPEATPAPPAARIELIPFEDRLLVDDGTRSDAWQREGDARAVQELVVDGATVRRTLALDGDQLVVETTVTRGDDRDAWRTAYAREA
jgi:hypothetical protein